MDTTIEISNQDEEVIKTIPVSWETESGCGETRIWKIAFTNDKGKEIDVDFDQWAQKWQMKDFMMDLLIQAIFAETGDNFDSDGYQLSSEYTRRRR